MRGLFVFVEKNAINRIFYDFRILAEEKPHTFAADWMVETVGLDCHGKIVEMK